MYDVFNNVSCGMSQSAQLHASHTTDCPERWSSGLLRMRSTFQIAMFASKPNAWGHVSKEDKFVEL